MMANSLDKQNSAAPAKHFMQRALDLALLGRGWVNPNPLVGAVLVEDGRIIGEGYHQRYGYPHAERNAIAAALASGKDEALTKATLYVTLEPCCHTGKTPPCTKAIIEHNIPRVVVGSKDPNPQVAGGGIAQLEAAGIEVITGFMKEECDALNQIFFHYIKHKTPYVLMKYAMTLDGKIATRTGASKWITGSAARADVHRLRGCYAAILVGIDTVIADDPLLNCRAANAEAVLQEVAEQELKAPSKHARRSMANAEAVAHDPLRVICDSSLRIPLNSQIVQTASLYPTLVATTVSSDTASKVQEAKIAQLLALNCQVLTLPSKDNRLDLAVLMTELGKRSIDSVLIEGGATINGSALEAGIVNKVRCYLAPKIFGGAKAPSPVGASGVALPGEAFCLKNISFGALGEDLYIEGEVW